MVIPSTKGEQVQRKKLGCIRCEVPIGHLSGETIRQLDIWVWSSEEQM